MNVAVYGLGLMGTAIAERLLDAGHEVTVGNRSPGKAGDLLVRGAREAGTMAELWSAADVCVTMLADSAALETVATGPEGLLAAAGPGKTLIDMSTVSVEASAHVAAAAAAGGVTYLRAPVSGNPVAVRGGKLGIVVSGERDTFDDLAHLLTDIGPALFYLGDGEAARVMKLALNLMIAGTAELLAEAVTLGEAHGLDRAAMLDVIAGSAVGSPFVTYKKGPLVANDYTSTFSTRLMHKDLDLALASAAGGGVPLPVTAMVQQLLQGCIAAGLGDVDFMALLPRLQQEARGELPDIAESAVTERGLSVPSAGDRYQVMADVVTFLVTDADSCGRLVTVQIDVPTGGGPPPLHIHPPDEVFHVLDGRVTVFVAAGETATRRELGPGATAHVPGGTAHTFRNFGDQPARMIVTFAPGLMMERFFVSAGHRILEGEAPAVPDMEREVSRVFEAAGVLGMELLAPPDA